MGEINSILSLFFSSPLSFSVFFNLESRRIEGLFIFRLLLLFLLLVFTSVGDAFSQQKVSILGDTYSVFYGHVTPDTNLCWYGVSGEKKENDLAFCRLLDYN